MVMQVKNMLPQFSPFVIKHLRYFLWVEEASQTTDTLGGLWYLDQAHPMLPYIVYNV